VSAPCIESGRRIDTLRAADDGLSWPPRQFSSRPVGPRAWPGSRGLSVHPSRRAEEAPRAFVVVTVRPTVKLRLRSVSAALGLVEPVCIARPEDALPVFHRGVGLVVDLVTTAREPALAQLVRDWERERPDCPLVLIAPLIDRETELKITVALLHAVERLKPTVLTVGDFLRDEPWHTLMAYAEHAALERALWEELRATAAASGRAIRGEPAVREVLLAASRPPRAGVHAMAAPFAVASSSTVRARKALSGRLRRAGQAPPSQLLLAFRVLWLAKLRARGWRTDRVADFLGYDSPREFRRAVRRRLGIGVRELARVPYRALVCWAADFLTASGGAGASMSAALGAPLAGRCGHDARPTSERSRGHDADPCARGDPYVAHCDELVPGEHSCAARGI
jgi:hypothetical protein